MENVEFNIEASYSGSTDIKQFLGDLDTLGNRLKNVGSTGTGIAKAERDIRKLDKAVKDSARGQREARDEAILLGAVYKEGLLVIKAREAAERAAAQAIRDSAKATRDAAKTAPGSGNFQQRAAELQRQQRLATTEQRKQNKLRRDALKTQNQFAQRQRVVLTNLKDANRALRRRALLTEAATPSTAAAASSSFIGPPRPRGFIDPERKLIQSKETLERTARAARRTRRELGRSAKNASKLSTGLKTSSVQAGRLHRRFRLFNGTAARSLISVTSLAAVFATLSAIAKGVSFADQLERAEVQIAGLTASTTQLIDENGNLLSTTDGYAAALGLAREQVQGLRKDAIETTATFDELLENFQTAIGPGLSAGLDLGQIRELTVTISQAAQASGIAQNQLAEEIRSLVTGNINPRNSRIATILGITPADVKAAREAGVLFEFLTEKLGGIKLAAKDLGDTLQKTFSKLGDQLLQVAGEGFNPFRQQLIDLGKTLKGAFSEGGLGIAAVAQLGEFLRSTTESLTAFIAGLDANSIDAFFASTRQVASALVDISAVVVKSVIPVFTLLAAVLAPLANTLETLSGAPLVSNLLLIGSAVLIITPLIVKLIGSLAGLRVALFGVAAGSAAASGGLTVVTRVVAGLVAAAAAAAIASDSLETPAEAATKSTQNLNDALKALEVPQRGTGGILSIPIAQMLTLGEASKETEADLKKLQRALDDSRLTEGLEGSFDSLFLAGSNIEEVSKEPLDALNASILETETAFAGTFDQAKALNSELARLEPLLSPGTTTRFGRSFSLSSQTSDDKQYLLYLEEQNRLIDKQQGLEKTLTKLKAQRLDLAKRLADAEEQQIAQKAELVRLTSETLSGDIQNEITNLETASKIAQARLDAGDVSSSPQRAFDLDETIKQIEQEAQKKKETLTLTALQNKVEGLRLAKFPKAAAALSSLVDLYKKQLSAAKDLATAEDGIAKAALRRIQNEERAAAIRKSAENRIFAEEGRADRLDDSGTQEGAEAAQRIRIQNAVERQALAAKALADAQSEGKATSDVLDLERELLAANLDLEASAARYNAILREGKDLQQEATDQTEANRIETRLQAADALSESPDATPEDRVVAQRIRVGVAEDFVKASEDALASIDKQKTSVLELGRLEAQRLADADTLAGALRRLLGLQQRATDEAFAAQQRQQNALEDEAAEGVNQVSFESRNDGNLRDEIAAQGELVAKRREGVDLIESQIAKLERVANSDELALDLKEKLVAAQQRLNREVETEAELKAQERREGTLAGGFEAGLQNQERRRGQIAEDFTGESFGILRNSLSQAVAIAFDPNQNFDLSAGIEYIGLQIGQALANALLEQIVVQPIVSGIQGLFGLAAANSGGAVRPGGILPSYASGGTVGSPNLTRAPRGAHPKDKVLAALTPGEGVLNVGAMQALGTDWLHKMNRNFGSIKVGTHIKKKLRDQGIPGFNSGGPVGTGRQRTLGRRPTVGSQSQVVLVADRERSRQILRGRAFDERTIKSARTINALRP